QATADSRQLALTCAISDAALVSPPDGTGPAWQMDVNLDARSYGKRLEHGSTATVRITGGVADGPAQVHDIPTWAFGNEYAAVFDPKEFKATLSTAPDGRRLISLTLPKTYMYLHEWALENGNSQLGVNVHLTIRQASVDGKERLTSYALSVNAKPVDDVDSLVVLELCTKPTTRVTVNVF
ncbi:MAG: hypothetical protein U0984_02100, partial [Prosthecobacter sp.]|nr:hypothetical protein [Prosthecobacter sp.]